MNSNERGTRFEARIHDALRHLADKHPGFVEVSVQQEITLLNGQARKPDFELVYRTDQEHRELIECQSRERSSLEIADKIKVIKTFSSRNRFIFVFEDPLKLSHEHHRVREADGVNCLSVDELHAKLNQLDCVLISLKRAVNFDQLCREDQNWRTVLKLLFDEVHERRRKIYDRPSQVMPDRWD